MRPIPLITVPSRAALPHTFGCHHGDGEKSKSSQHVPQVSWQQSHTLPTRHLPHLITDISSLALLEHLITDMRLSTLGSPTPSTHCSLGELNMKAARCPSKLTVLCKPHCLKHPQHFQQGPCRTPVSCAHSLSLTLISDPLHLHPLSAKFLFLDFPGDARIISFKQ